MIIKDIRGVELGVDYTKVIVKPASFVNEDGTTTVYPRPEISFYVPTSMFDDYLKIHEFIMWDYKE